MEKYQFKIKDILYDVLATYYDDDTRKNYMVYTDKKYDENHQLKLYYSLYEEVDNNIKLIEINDIEDKKICLQLIQELMNDINREI